MTPSTPPPPSPRQLDLALDSPNLSDLTPSQRTDALIALAMMLREAAEPMTEAENDERL